MVSETKFLHRVRSLAYIILAFILSIEVILSQTRNAAEIATAMRLPSQFQEKSSSESETDVDFQSLIQEVEVEEDPIIILQDQAPENLIAEAEPSIFRNVSFMDKRDWGHMGEAYSGMWWQSVNGFLSMEWVGMRRLEEVSFKAFGNQRVRMTKDWLDFSVTHLSRIWKHFETHRDENDYVALAQVEQYLNEFVQAAAPLPILESAAPDTIAVLPYVVSGPSATRGHSIDEKALLATMVSLWESGMARIVVVLAAAGPSQAEVLIQSLSTFMQEKLNQRGMELQFIVLTDLTRPERRILPQTALRRLELALRDKLDTYDANRWLGEQRRDWKFVYFSEPDLILHARTTTMKALKEEMDAGHTLSGHRLEVVYHEDNFPGYNRPDKVVPRLIAPLPAPMDLLDETQSCCDAGRHYPANLADPSSPGRLFCFPSRELWWNCGFRKQDENYTDVETLQRLHAKLVNYPLVTMLGRLPFPLVNEHQHVCHFHDNGMNCAVSPDSPNNSTS